VNESGGKKRSNSQRIGERGEALFALRADDGGLLPNRTERDYGVDFLCQVVGDSDQQGNADVGGAIIGICVRSTASARGRVRLTRKDATQLLKLTFPSMMVVPHLVNAETLYLVLIDADFQVRLYDFLATTKQQLIITTKHCRPWADIRKAVEECTRPGWLEEVRLEVASRRIAPILDATISVHRDQAMNWALVETDDFFNFFDLSSQDDQVFDLVFGASELAVGRLTQLPVTPAIWEAVGPISTTAVLGGLVGEAQEVELEVEGPAGAATAHFWRRGYGKYTGYAHDAGFALAISDPVMDDGRHVHEVRTHIDVDLDVELNGHRDLLQFLRLCRRDSIIRERDSGQRGVEALTFPNLEACADFADMILRVSESAPSLWSVLRLRDVQSPEACTLLSIAHRALTDPAPIQRFGFVIERESTRPNQDYRSVPAQLETPIVARCSTGMVVLWIRSHGLLLTRGRTTHGFRIGQILGVSFEPRAPLVKSTDDPELCTDPTWPTVALGSAPRMTDSNARDWGLEMRVIDHDGVIN